MIGITSFGGYIPRLRLNRMSIVQNVGWLAPAIVMVAQGERAFCNWDEDSLTMAVAASQDCLKGRDKAKVDGLFLCSTTLPFADRSGAGMVKTALNLSDQLATADFTSSQRAGTMGLLQALSAVGSGHRQEVLVAAADQRQAKTAYFYEMWFGDGAAALTVGSQDVVAEFLGSHTVSQDFVDHYRGADQRYDYVWEERWVRDLGYARIIPAAMQGLLDKLDISMNQVSRLVFPCFFAAEHRKIAAGLGASGKQVMDNLHEVCGETGAAHPLVMLVKALEEAAPGDIILAAGFGQGADALCFRVTEAMAQLPSRLGINGSLAAKKTSDNYTKFLKFRELLPTETGIRAEAPTQTAMTVLWRKRDMVLGMVGGRCTACGTPQFPKAHICVNPKCRALDTQEPYEFADQPAKVRSFTGDLLAVSVDPPAIYGMVEFEAGGRFMADFTDCAMDEVTVGAPVRLAFRKRYHDAERGFTGYFWKAIPLPQAKPKAKYKDRLDFSGRVALVTGAGAGLGRDYALALAARGAAVVVNDLGGAADGSGASTRAADLVVEEIKKAGGQAVANYDSVATPEGGAAVVGTALTAFGRLDIVINNAGILRDKTLAKLEPADWKAVLAVHLDGAYHVTRAAWEPMRSQGHGRIVFTTSAAGLHGNFGQSNYSAAKLGLVGLMNTLKLEGAKYGIKVNTVAPIAGTRLTEGILPPEMFQRLRPEFITPLVLYLCSEKCTDSGLIFNAGGGYFNRAAILTGAGVKLGAGEEPPSLEEIHAHFAQIDDLSQGQEFSDATSALGPLMAALEGGGQPAPAAKEPPAGEASAVARVFARMPDAFDASAAQGVAVVFQFEISGPQGGAWQAVIQDGACTVAQGAHDNPTTTIQMGDEDFLAMISGQLNPMTAYTSGKLKIQGDLMKSQLISKLFKF